MDFQNQKIDNMRDFKQFFLGEGLQRPGFGIRDAVVEDFVNFQ